MKSQWNRVVHLVILGALTITKLVGCAPPAVARWSTYREHSGTLEVQYPSDWYVLQSGNGRLALLSFPPEVRARGAILIPGGAEILVATASHDAQSLTSWMLEETKEAAKVSSLEVPTELKENRHCKFTCVSYDNELGPGTWTSNYACFCEGNGKLARVRLTSLGAKNEQDLLRVFRGVAASLKP